MPAGSFWLPRAHNILVWKQSILLCCTCHQTGPPRQGTTPQTQTRWAEKSAGEAPASGSVSRVRGEGSAEQPGTHTGLTRHYGRGAGKDPCRGSGVLPWGKGRGWETHRAPWLEQRSQGSRTDGIYLFFYLTRMEPCCPPSIVINALQNEHTGPQRGLRVAFLSPLPR